MASKPHVDVLLYGLGAIGSFYAFILSRSEQVRLTVVARSNYEAVKANGLRISSANHGSHTVIPHQVVRTAAEAESKFDYVVCAHKAIDQWHVPAQIAPAVDPERTTLVIIQNGVGNEEPFREKFPDVTILSCVTWVGAKQPSPGVIEHTTSEDMQMGLFPNAMNAAAVEQQRLAGFAALLERGRTTFQVVPNVQVQRWEKVVWNAAWNPLTTLTMLDTHAWLGSSPDAAALTRRLMAEVVDVARRCGVPVEHALVDRLMAKILDMPPIGSSMQVDCRNGRPLEVDVILGYPVRKGRELGCATPVLETVHAIVLAVDERLKLERTAAP